MKKHEIFESNPELKQVHFTSDGQAFFKESDAKNHAKTLEDKKVELVVNPSEFENILEDFDDDQDDGVLGDLKTKFIDDSNAGAAIGSFEADDLDDDDLDDDDQDDLNQDEDHQNDGVADFSDEKIGEGIKEPLTEIIAEADGSENILTEKQDENIIAESKESTEDPASTEEKPAEEKKSNAKKNK